MQEKDVPLATSGSPRRSLSMHIVRLRVKLGGKAPADRAEFRRTYGQRDYPVAAPPTRGADASVSNPDMVALLTP